MPIDVTTAKRLRYDGTEAYLGLALTDSATQIQFKAPLTCDGGAPVGTLQSDEYMVLSLLDANYRLREIVFLTAYNEGDITGTIQRGAEGTIAKSHVVDSKVVHSATVMDYVLVQEHDEDGSAHPEILTQANAYTDAKMTAHVNDVDAHPAYAKKAGDTFTGDVVFDGSTKTVTVKGSLVIPDGAKLIVEGELWVSGKLFLNGRQVIADNVFPTAPAANTIYIQTFG